MHRREEVRISGNDPPAGFFLEDGQRVTGALYRRRTVRRCGDGELRPHERPGPEHLDLLDVADTVDLGTAKTGSREVVVEFEMADLLGMRAATAGSGGTLRSVRYSDHLLQMIGECRGNAER